MTAAATAPEASRSLTAGKREGFLFSGMCLLATWSSMAMLLVLLGVVLWDAWGWLDWQFLSSYSSMTPAKAGILPGLLGSAWVISITIVVAVPVGIGAALYLEEFGRDSALSRVIQTNLANLAGVPSIVYGILGLTVFVNMFDLFGPGRTFQVTEINLLGLHVPLPLGKCVVAAALTLSLMILPVIIVAAQEALRAVPPSLRHAALALGATHWQTIRHQVLPSALPGIMTGVILAVSRAIGEAAPLILVGAATFILSAPGHITSPRDVITQPSRLLEAPFDTYTVMPIQIFDWAQQAKADFRTHVASAGIVVLLAVLLLLNAAAIIIRNRSQKRLRP